MTPLAIHAFAVVRPGVALPVWRSDSWTARQAGTHHLHLVAPSGGAQLNLFGAAA